MFTKATGWLGWSAHDALNTPICQIHMAIDGRIEWARITNPFGGGEEAEKPKEDVGERLKSFFRGQV